MKFTAVKNLMESLGFTEEETREFINILQDKEGNRINTVIGLIDSLSFTTADKQTLIKTLQSELPAEAIPVSQSSTQAPKPESKKEDEYGKTYEFELLFLDGKRGNKLRYSSEVYGIIIKRSGRCFALYCRPHSCDNACRPSVSAAQDCAAGLPKINGKSWRLIKDADCQAMYDQSFFYSLNAVLKEVGCRTLPESQTVEVLTSDGKMRGSDWQAWFVMDL